MFKDYKYEGPRFNCKSEMYDCKITIFDSDFTKQLKVAVSPDCYFKGSDVRTVVILAIMKSYPEDKIAKNLFLFLLKCKDDTIETHGENNILVELFSFYIKNANKYIEDFSKYQPEIESLINFL